MLEKQKIQGSRISVLFLKCFHSSKDEILIFLPIMGKDKDETLHARSTSEYSR